MQRDSSSVASFVVDDGAAAEVAALRYRAEDLPSLEAVAGFEDLRWPEERLHAVYPGATLEVSPPDGTALLLFGDLYLTSSRLLHAGGQLFEMVLGAIDQTAMALERLVVVCLRDGSQVAVLVDDPRVLREQIAAAQAATKVSDEGLRADEGFGAGEGLEVGA